ncbi:MAG: LLM class flavin-dependent oxidoreductase [Euzebya sp.]
MRFGLTICNHGEYADPTLLGDLAVAAEHAGWDGVFVWDHIARDGEPPMTDPWIALAGIAARTSRVSLGPMVTPLARRRPWKLARETVALDHLSQGRMILGVGLGVHDEEFAMLGEEATPSGRAALLDEGLQVLTALWTGDRVNHHGPAHEVTAHFRPGPVRAAGQGQRFGIPIWVAGTWPIQAPFRRAARFDGAFPISRTGELQPEDYRQMRDVIGQHRQGQDPFTLVHQGSGEPGDIDRWAAFADAGVNWWLESFRSETQDVADCRRVIAKGPPGA